MARVQQFDASPIAGDYERWNKLPLENGKKKEWDNRRTMMLWTVPSFSDIWYSMMVDKDGEQAWFTDQTETAATDDKFLYLNPTFFFKLTIDEAVFVLTHEIMHAMYGHAGLFWTLQQQKKIIYPDGIILPVEIDLLQWAADYVINDQLVQSKIGAKPEMGLHWPQLINGNMSVLDAYRILYEMQEKQGNNGSGGGSGGGSGSGGGLTRGSKNGQVQGPGSGKPFDKVLPPGTGRGKSPVEAQAERKQVLWDTAIASAMASAKLKGQLPEYLDRLFTKQLQPQADWRELYALTLSKKVGNDRYTWGNLNQQLAWRGIGAPGRTTHGCELVIIARDSSGSINDETCAVFGAETRGVLENANPKRIIIVDCDAEVHRFEEISDMAELESPAFRKVIGGGGTDFRPVFDRIAKEGLEPDALVYLTDLYGDFPSMPPSYPVVWGSISGDHVKPPWGETVLIPKQAGVED